jgi:hypothetical protein
MEKLFKEVGLEVEVRKAKEMQMQAKIELKENDLIKKYRDEHKHEPPSGNFLWLKSVHNQRRERSIQIWKRAIDSLMSVGFK